MYVKYFSVMAKLLYIYPYHEPIVSITLKVFKMNSLNNYHYSVSRRNFILAALTCPILINEILFNDKNEEFKPLPQIKMRIL